jgi:DNA-directed RNA polymerase sigma subunit (sigma70/sigma32)
MKNKNTDKQLSSLEHSHNGQASSPELVPIVALRQELASLLQEQVHAHCIDEREALLLSLRLGLIDGECFTLQKVGDLLHISPEWVRQRQYFLLKKKIKDPYFSLKLKEYSHLTALPRGIRPREEL